MRNVYLVELRIDLEEELVDAIEGDADTELRAVKATQWAFDAMSRAVNRLADEADVDLRSTGVHARPLGARSRWRE